MKALVVYESMFGNTEQVARAVADGLGESMDVALVEVGTAPGDPGADVTLVVVGGPTHAFSMTRPSTRADAARKAGGGKPEDLGVREWLAGLPAPPPSAQLATFDTRARAARRLPGSAARSAARAARHRGYRLAARPESFYVGDTAGPLLDGELTRATAWGREVGRKVAARAAAGA
jgi:hypothetical protein